MKLVKKTIFVSLWYPAYLLLILNLLLPVTDLTAQDLSSKPSRQSSLEAFSKGNYEQAYLEFSELLVKYPKDPMYKYYSGVCLVKLKREPERALTQLTQAQQGSAIVRTIPSDVLFWLGRAQQMSGKFEEAIISYNSFIDINGRKTSRELGIPDFIQQCEKREGLLTKENEPGITEEETNIIQAEDMTEMIIATTDTLTGDYDKMLAEALEYQYKADSIYRVAEEQKKGLETGSYAERTKIKAEIAETEKLAASFQDLADTKYDEAQAAMNSRPFTTGLITEQVRPPAADSSIQNVSDGDSLIISTDSSRIKDTTKTEEIEITDNKVVIDTAAVDRPTKKAEIYSHFEVKQSAADEKIPVDPKVPDGLLYRIQVAVFRNPVASSYFKGLTPVYGFKMPGRDLTIYYAGMFRRLSDANRALTTVRQKGFRDAFVSAFFKGKAISMERAGVLEKEWGKISLNGVKTEEQVLADTVPPTLTFRVEIARSSEPAEDEDLEDFKRLSGTRGLEIITLPNDTIVYLIGTFITWDSAEEYADLLVRNGYPDAKVGAWLGKREIPVEKARELFEMLE